MTGRSGDRPRADECVAVPLAPTLMGMGPAGAELVVRLIDDFARRHRYASLPPHVQKLREVAADVAAHVHRGPADVRSEAVSSTWAADEITTKEAARLLGCTDKHVRRLAVDGRLGRTRVVAGRRLVSAAHVAAYIAERKSA